MASSDTLDTERRAVAAPVAATTEPRRLALARRPLHITFTGILTIVGAVLGFQSGIEYVKYLTRAGLKPSAPDMLIEVAILAVGGLVGFLLASILFRQLAEFVPRVEQMPVEDKIAGLFGVILGLIVAVLLQPLVRNFGTILVVVTYCFSVSGGILFTISMKKELIGMFSSGSVITEEEAALLKEHGAKPKLLDTNIIIDGRILDIWNSGFIEGELLVPQFVLDELQLIADSADDLKRARGRRGLDLLNRMKEEVGNFRVLRARDYPVPVDDVDGVDHKLIRLATHMEAALVTNDFNLNRVADVQGIPVLNVNRLALSLKPVVIAGEEMTVHIIRPGRDPGQGVAYLDDGTMVVVEDGEPKIGKVVDVLVTSLLQTVAGKMIFAQLKDPGYGGKGGNGR